MGLTYAPLFPYFAEAKAAGAFRVVADGYVSAGDGTGVVHNAPGFGEDDLRVCVAQGIIKVTDVPCPINDDGEFTLPVADFVGKYAPFPLTSVACSGYKP